ncbi:uncharacterized protein LOC109855117 [Pseudomyrmex gracilis]|uniref:uncharacterized protein LOC109855117 n=1 Tax=Pseudomyrmex gracilis TaxID=219809 RepID=UPI000994F152|nr:uncharacterized protein LOC109855117 [Pseudomyrmex gracilis]
MKLLAKLLILTTAVVLIAGQSIDECLKQDSISCVQKTLYRTAKEFFAKDTLELVNGISLVKSNAEAGSSRSGKALAYDQEMNAANDIVARQNTLENFVNDEAGQFLTGRSIRINLAPAFEKLRESARAISESVPPEIRQAVDEVVEARGKKKQLKNLIPLLIAAKVKLGLLATLAYFAIGIIAKKAIFASLISLAISAFIGLKALWSGKGGSVYHHDLTAYNNGWNAPVASGWSGPVNTAWSSPVSSGWDEHASYAHNQAYSGYHH